MQREGNDVKEKRLERQRGFAAVDIACAFSDEPVSILLAIIPRPNNSHQRESSCTGARCQRYTSNNGQRCTRYENLSLDSRNARMADGHLVVQHPLHVVLDLSWPFRLDNIVSNGADALQIINAIVMQADGHSEAAGAAAWAHPHP